MFFRRQCFATLALMMKPIMTASLFVALLAGAPAVVATAALAQGAGEAHSTITGPNLHNPDANADPEEVLDRLFAQLRQADSEDTAKVLESAIQAMWMRSGSDTADVLMKQAGAAIEKKSYGSALAILDTVVELNPDFAEGWNRRATVHFLRGDYTNSQADIERVLELEPRHYGALSGLGAIEKERGNGRAALRALRKARTINPKLDDIDDRIRKLEQEYDQEI
jgi:tetratricopeptide (TPR) repeat protein